MMPSKHLFSFWCAGIFLIYFTSPCSSTSNSPEGLRSNFWDISVAEEFSQTWNVPSKSVRMFYRYRQPPVEQTYTDAVHFSPDSRSLNIGLRQDTTTGAWTSPMVMSQGQFPYGEFEWIAKIAPSPNTLNVFRVHDGWWYWRTPSGSTDERRQGPAVQLQVEWRADGGTVLRAAVSFLSVLQQRSPWPDVSDQPGSSWIDLRPDCSICQGVDLSLSYFSYKLKWTEDELVWSINGTDIYRLVDANRIPHYSMQVATYLVHTNSPSMREGNFSIFSFVMRPSPTTPVPVQEISRPGVPNQTTEYVESNFPNSTLAKWRVLEGVAGTNAKYSQSNSEFFPLYDRHCVRFGERTIELLMDAGQSDSHQTVFRSPWLEALQPVLYGEVEWSVRVMNLIEGVSHSLMLAQQPCQVLGYPVYSYFSCRDAEISPNIHFLIYGSKNSPGQPVVQAIFGSRLYGTTAFPPRTLPASSGTADFRRYRVRWTKDHVTWLINNDVIGNITSKGALLPHAEMFITMTSTLEESVEWALNSSFTIPGLEIRQVKYIPAAPDAQETLKTSREPPAGAGVFMIAASVTGGVAVVLTLFLVILVRRRRRVMRSRAATRTARMRPADKGVVLSEIAGSYTPLPCQGSSERYHKQYAKFMEVSLDALDIGNEILGRGEFGIVFKGVARRLPTIALTPVEVAVKSLTKNSNPVKLQEELRVMEMAGRHLNIVNLLGAVFSGGLIRYLILELCQYGDLASYLRSISHHVIIHVTSSGTLMPCQNERKCSESSRDTPAVLCSMDLIKFAHQVSRGMQYLRGRSILHRDLAARNVLVAEDHVAKISDFGLAKLGHQQYTVTDKQVPLPVRWMPPETIQTGTFSYASDVWSFGVVLWEIFSHGKTPFSTNDVSNFSAHGFARWLLEGNLMSSPVGTPSDIYKLMQDCWNLSAESRPEFTDLELTLRQIVLAHDKGKNYLDLLDVDWDISPAYKALLETDMQDPIP